MELKSISTPRIVDIFIALVQKRILIHCREVPHCSTIMDENSPLSQHTEDVEIFKGTKDFENTLRNIAVSVKALAQHSCRNDTSLNDLTSIKEKEMKSIKLFQEKLFGTSVPEQPVSKRVKHKIRWELIDFAVKYRKKDGNRTSYSRIQFLLTKTKGSLLY